MSEVPPAARKSTVPAPFAVMFSVTVMLPSAVTNTLPLLVVAIPLPPVPIVRASVSSITISPDVVVEATRVTTVVSMSPSAVNVPIPVLADNVTTLPRILTVLSAARSVIAPPVAKRSIFAPVTTAIGKPPAVSSIKISSPVPPLVVAVNDVVALISRRFVLAPIVCAAAVESSASAVSVMIVPMISAAASSASSRMDPFWASRVTAKPVTSIVFTKILPGVVLLIMRFPVRALVIPIS